MPCAGRTRLLHRLRMPGLVPGILLSALLCGPALACRVERRATLPLTRAGGLFLVPVAINGSTEPFVLDTGAERTVISDQAAARLNVARDEWVSTDIQGAGGRDRQRLGRPSSLALGGIPLRRHTLAADSSVVVGPIPTQAGDTPIAGLLGEDYLSTFDLDLDAPANTLTLYTVESCAGRFLPWHAAYQALPTQRPVRNMLALPIQIGPTRLLAELDSGASNTVITLPGMIALGLQSGGADQVSGFGRGHLAARVQHVAAFSVAGLPPAPADLLVAPLRSLRSIGALLGADWLASRHVWISWSTTQIFLAQPGS